MPSDVFESLTHQLNHQLTLVQKLQCTALEVCSQQFSLLFEIFWNYMYVCLVIGSVHMQMVEKIIDIDGS